MIIIINKEMPAVCRSVGGKRNKPTLHRKRKIAYDHEKERVDDIGRGSRG